MNDSDEENIEFNEVKLGVELNDSRVVVDNEKDASNHKNVIKHSNLGSNDENNVKFSRKLSFTDGLKNKVLSASLENELSTPKKTSHSFIESPLSPRLLSKIEANDEAKKLQTNSTFNEEVNDVDISTNKSHYIMKKLNDTNYTSSLPKIKPKKHKIKEKKQITTIQSFAELSQ